jgi:hypothetical protein
MNHCIAFLIGIMLIAATGCVTSEKIAGDIPAQDVTQLPATPVPVQSTLSAVTFPASAPKATISVIITQSPVITPAKTPAQISDSALNARIQDAKNKLDQLKDSDKADTIVKSAQPPLYCEIRESKELGYLIDANTGDMFFVKGDYGSIDIELFRQNMTLGHDYIILHTHAKDLFICSGRGTIGLNTFSLSDLTAASNLTAQGYHVQKVIAVSDKNYEVFPKIRDDWRTKEEVYKGVEDIEQRMEVKFSIYDPYWKQTFYDVDNIMPLLAKELNYTYIANHVVLA